jgi:hypothetical protein
MRLEINGKEADMANNILAITRQVIDLSNLSLRNIDITNRLQLPKTNPNQEIFESADRVETNGTGMDQLYRAKIIDQSIIFNGVGFLNEANDSYNFQLSEASKDVLSNLGEKINRLDWDQYDFTFNNTSSKTLKVVTNSVWIWPIICMHEEKVSANTRFESGSDGLKYSRPCFNFKKILETAIENQGWAIELDTDLIDSVALSSNAEKFYVTSYQKTLDDELTLSGEQSLTNLDNNDFENDVTTTSTTIDIGTNPTAFRLRGNINAETDAVFKVKSTASPSGKEQIKEYFISSDQEFIDIKSSVFKVSGSDTSITIELSIEGSGDFDFLDTLLYTVIEENDFGDLSTNPLLDFRVKAYDNMPDIDQEDILRDAIKLTNSILEPDSLNRNIKLRSLKALSKLRSIDWSEKFDADNYTVTNRVTGYAKTNYLVYDNDETVQSDLGEDSFTINNQSLKDVEDVLQLKYGASVEVSVDNFTLASFEAYNDNERINDLNDRIVYFELEDSGDLRTIGRFLQLDWRTLKEEYYKNWFASFNRLRIVEGEADLNKLDVIGHDFLNLVYIEHFKSSFFVHIIEDYVPGRKTQVELFKFL